MVIRYSLYSDNTAQALEWQKRFEDSLSIFGVEKLYFDLGTNPPRVTLWFTLSEGSRLDSQKTLEVWQNLIGICNFKASLLDHDRAEKIETIHGKVRRFCDYLLIWKDGAISCDEYVNLREHKYPRQVDLFKKENEKVQTAYSKEQLSKTVSIIKEIEDQELVEVYGGRRFKMNLHLK